MEKNKQKTALGVMGEKDKKNLVYGTRSRRDGKKTRSKGDKKNKLGLGVTEKKKKEKKSSRGDRKKHKKTMSRGDGQKDKKKLGLGVTGKKQKQKLGHGVTEKNKKIKIELQGRRKKGNKNQVQE